MKLGYKIFRLQVLRISGSGWGADLSSLLFKFQMCLTVRQEAAVLKLVSVSELHWNDDQH